MFRFCSVSICSGSVQYQYVQVLFSINDIDIALTYHTIAGAPIERATMKHVARLGFISFSMVVETQLWNLLTVSKSPHVLFDPIGFDLIFLFLKHNFNRIYTFKNCSSRGFVRSSSRCRLQSLRWQWRWKTIKQVRKLFKITLRPKKKTCI